METKRIENMIEASHNNNNNNKELEESHKIEKR